MQKAKHIEPPQSESLFYRNTNYLCLLVVFCLLTQPTIIFSSTITVSPNSVYETVESAIRVAKPYDTILIKPGYYNECGLSVDFPITLKGVDYPIIDGDHKGQILTVKSSEVTITGIEFNNSKVSFVDDNSAILLEDVSNCKIINNRFNNNFFAIYLAKSIDCQVENNVITGASVTESTSGNGIHLWYCRNIEIKNNSVSGHRDGIYFEFVKHSLVESNTSNNNLRYGLHFMFSDTCKYTENVFSENGAGVAVMYTHYVKMENNVFKHNWGSSSYGLLLKEITDSHISNNQFIENSIAIYIEGCNRLTVTENEIRGNGWGLRLMSNSIDNEFSKNNFIGNSFQVGSTGRQNFSSFFENYWSDYAGYDLDRDGYGDVPFRPVSLFSVVVEKNPPTLVLVRSLTVEILNLAERLLPSLTPKSLIDTQPAMEPY